MTDPRTGERPAEFSARGFATCLGLCSPNAHGNGNGPFFVGLEAPTYD